MLPPEPRAQASFFRFDLQDRKMTGVDQYINSLKVVVASFPRSGTCWTCSMLQKLGVASGHERVFTTNTMKDPAKWKFTPGQFNVTVDVTGFAAEYLGDARARGIRVVHLLRHPLDTINSCLNYFTAHFKPECKREYWDWMCKTWLAYRLQNEKYSEFDVYLEEPYDAIRTVGGLLGKSWTDEELKEHDATARRGRSSKGVIGSWEDLPEDLRSYARSKGYGEAGFLGRPGSTESSGKGTEGEASS